MAHSCETCLVCVWHEYSCYIWRAANEGWHMWHNLFCVTCLIRVWHASFVCDVPHSCVTCLIRIWHVLSLCYTTYSMWHAFLVCHMPHLCVAWIFMLYLESSQKGLKFVTWVMRIRHVSFVRDMTHSCVTCLMCGWHEYSCCIWRKAVEGWNVWHNLFCVTCIIRV